ncbi:cysteine--tRNA ligase [Phormidesmis priestleyi ULC007]|uniref:Cysteine--tRNA ligase n=1 Tax=Phormidesmis priestleyi ULC007 TaxID=1920490 RepID=A0A2T1DAU3_9CYAN|nr:cysteine--tRNA ligase [Phormidesmis priestleyi]PSB17618.1 cysteine--tRNA ligase [Phormidesmis priestleyi ULC007]PZO48495.1 MAG: cysteine--tRNA ligase [Phormidesmis priestleyi]
MPLTLYNTLTRRKEVFDPIDPHQVQMYYCGVTVYDYCHLGHARACIVWDTVRRYLKWRGYNVRYVQNFTDIDDKILNRARQEGTSMEAVAEFYIQAYFEDMARLNVMEADEYPRATHTIDGIKRLIHELEQNGNAYPTAGDVYYSVRSFPGYGKLSGQKLDEMQTGASGRVEATHEANQPQKRDPADFALWKSAKPDEPAWESPWGAGRPGWHIECSAMVRECFADASGKRLGDTIDIHAGGNDLIFPHHENEIAQSEAVTGKPLSRYWMHNGMVNVGGEKMSKSLGNFTTIRDLLDRKGIDPMVIRLFVLGASYRKPIDFTDEALTAAQNGWNTLKEGLLFGYEYGDRLEWHDREDAQTSILEQFQTAMDDDFNTSSGLAVLFEIAKALQREGNLLVHQGKTDAPPDTLKQQWQTLIELAQVLGLEAKPEDPTSTNGLSDAAIETEIQRRRDAKIVKNFAEADRIRNELQAQGITLIDKPGGETLWHRS